MANEIPSAIHKSTLDKLFLSTPGDDLVNKLMYQMAKVPGFVNLFGIYKNTDTTKNTDNQRWADYDRRDWSLRQLPAINIFESQQEEKQAENGYLTGNISIQVYWPPNFRRSDLSRVPSAYRGTLLNFFASMYTSDMLDELYYIQRPEKVYGLNEFGKNVSWAPNTEGLVQDEWVPVTILNIAYRIDLRAWKRALEYMSRTVENPFSKTLDDLAIVSFDFQGVDEKFDSIPAWVEIEADINVTNP